jgi:hypothetical protein
MICHLGTCGGAIDDENIMQAILYHLSGFRPLAARSSFAAARSESSDRINLDTAPVLRPKSFAASDTEPSTAKRRSSKACIPCSPGEKMESKHSKF